MRNTFKRTNGFGNPMFDISTSEGRCKFIFDSDGCILKAFYGNTGLLVLVYSQTDQDEACLRDAMYQLLLLSPECFVEMFNEIKADDQRELAVEVAKRRSDELTLLSIQLTLQINQLDSII